MKSKSAKKKVVTFGETMMRLSPPGHSTFSQTQSLEMTFGGTEANVAISLAYFGLDSQYVTRFPETNLGQAATQYFRHHGVDTTEIIYGDQSIGIYFLEQGAIHRPSRITYQRDGSAFAELKPGMINWKPILEGADWFHWTGITPAISQEAADCCLEAIKVANDNKVIVSGDIHSRKNLWGYGMAPSDVLPLMVEGTDIIIAGPFDTANILGTDNDEKIEDFSSSSKRLMEAFPRIRKVFDKDRELISASHNKIKGRMWDGKREIFSSQFDILPIVDRLGTGDAFAAGLIYGLQNMDNDNDVIEFATAACALKHSIEGDANVVSYEDVSNLMAGNRSVRINR